jgi:hypothetical protein
MYTLWSIIVRIFMICTLTAVCLLAILTETIFVQVGDILVSAKITQKTDTSKIGDSLHNYI